MKVSRIHYAKTDYLFKNWRKISMTHNVTKTSERDNSEPLIDEVMFEVQKQFLSPAALQALATSLHGQLVLPGDADYAATQIVWNSTVDHYPALVVRCADRSDVMAAIAFAREQDMTVAVRSGGHSPAEYSTVDGGMVIDLSHMKSITINPEQRTARLEPGLTWNEVAGALQPYGLAITSGDTGTVGVGGLLLGGGIGWMVRKHGLTVDRLRAVELVTADGQLLRASADENAELFWGLRGGGGNFGIATAFEVDLHPAGMVLGGAVFYDMREAEAILQAYTRYAATAPDELTGMALLMAAPPAPFIPPEMQGLPSIVIFVCYTGDLAEGERVLAPLRALGTPVADVIAPIPYPVMFAFTQEAAIPGLQQYVRSQFLKALPDEVIHTIVEASTGVICRETLVQVRILGGAMSRVAADATAFAHRDKQVMISVFNTEPKVGADASRVAQADQIWQALRPYTDGVYVNFLAEEGAQRVREAYPPATYARLAALKRRYDPTNLFHLNQNIVPA
jgi:FAD/FMN-containing dehydrogenase